MQKKICFLYFDLGGIMLHYDNGLKQLAKENGLALLRPRRTISSQAIRIY